MLDFAEYNYTDKRFISPKHVLHSIRRKYIFYVTHTCLKCHCHPRESFPRSEQQNLPRSTLLPLYTNIVIIVV